MADEAADLFEPLDFNVVTNAASFAQQRFELGNAVLQLVQGLAAWVDRHAHVLAHQLGDGVVGGPRFPRSVIRRSRGA